MTGITTVIFDAFGTLFEDSPDYWDAAMSRIIGQQGLAVSVATLTEEWLAACADFRHTRSQPGTAFQSYATAWQEGFAAAFRALNLAGDAAAAAAVWIADMAQRPAYPDTRPALRAVASTRRVVVLSNADDSFLAPVLARLDFPFAETFSSEAAQTYKPNPAFFQSLLQQLKVPAGQAVYVGDRQYEDVQGGGNAGLTTVWINRAGLPPDPSLRPPDSQVTSLMELPALLDHPSTSSG